jgi:hypothetical protein
MRETFRERTQTKTNTHTRPCARAHTGEDIRRMHLLKPASLRRLSS